MKIMRKLSLCLGPVMHCSTRAGALKPARTDTARSGLDMSPAGRI